MHLHLPPVTFIYLHLPSSTSNKLHLPSSPSSNLHSPSSTRLTFHGSMTRKLWKPLKISIKHDTFESVNSKEAAILDLLVLLHQVSTLFRNFLAISENADKQRLPCTRQLTN